MYVPLFSTDFTLFTVNPAVTGSSPCFSQKIFRAFAKADETEGSPLSIFFGTVRLFFLFFAFKRSHIRFFLKYCSKLKCQKAQRVSPFKYFGTMRLFKILIFRFFFCKFQKRIFCLQRVPPSFLIFCYKLDLQKAPRVPFYSFKSFALFEP